MNPTDGTPLKTPILKPDLDTQTAWVNRTMHPSSFGPTADAQRACAKQFLDRKGVAYTERRLKSDGSMQRAFARATGGARTVPQILVGEQRVGGFDDLVNLDRTGELDVLLGRTESLPQLSFWQRVMRALKG